MKYTAPEMEMKDLEVDDILMSNEVDEPTEPTEPTIPQLPDDER